jgi:hypothetical protein
MGSSTSGEDRHPEVPDERHASDDLRSQIIKARTLILLAIILVIGAVVLVALVPAVGRRDVVVTLWIAGASIFGGGTAVLARILPARRRPSKRALKPD